MPLRCRDGRRLDVVRKPDGTPPDLPRPADLLVSEVGLGGLSGMEAMAREWQRAPICVSRFPPHPPRTAGF